jgi:hypothetical protein
MRESESTRFWSHVDKTGECWLWTAYVSEKGYGQFRRNHILGRGYPLIKAHRYAWEDLVGPCPPGLEPDHLCYVRRCVNPAHIRWVTHQQNRQNYQGNERCGRGHPFVIETTGYHHGRRYCKTCANDRRRKQWTSQPPV